MVICFLMTKDPKCFFVGKKRYSNNKNQLQTFCNSF